MQRILLPTLLALAGLAPLGAQACTMTETGGLLTSVATQRVAGGPTVTTSANFNFSCSGVVLALANGTPTLKGQLQANTTGLTLKNTTNSSLQIPYQIYSNSGYSTGYASGALVVDLNGANLVGLLTTGSSTNVPLYIATTPGPNIPAGVYTDTVQVTWTYANICEGLIGALGACVGFPNNGTTTKSVTISLTVSNDCTITAPPVSFGSAPLLAGFPTVSQNISLQCSRNMVYTVGLSAGSYSSGARRRMASGTSRLAYDIFKADNTVWGSAGTDRAPGPAPATGTSVQTIPYTARIYQDQANPAPGTYTDNVVVDVSF
ncbi:spore coat protein U domain-containing protein [Pseudorhodoferax sp. Leaf274]|uniref:Csu type fimbrial protein n=1 Tax=Pseudorhodoferax sp. Leaf274 TaxID=1736318 RepID=UPI000702F962|nr:spore coat protein U domain-containing protein [Pseudorhodoferax sp. Leaf274]KQP43745.1 hypothetical protein ASF44_29290 [Pseudorhodoferax sp. Leaf274]